MSLDIGIFLPGGGGFTGVIPLIRPLLAIPERSAGVGDGWVPSLWWRTLAHPVLDFHLPLSVARASIAQCKCQPLIFLIFALYFSGRPENGWPGGTALCTGDHSILPGDRARTGRAQCGLRIVHRYVYQTGRYGETRGGVILSSRTRADDAISNL